VTTFNALPILSYFSATLKSPPLQSSKSRNKQKQHTWHDSRHSSFWS